MATMIRESGAWKDVLEGLGRHHIKVENITELPKTLNVQKAAYTEAEQIFERENKVLAEQYQKAIEELSNKHSQSIKFIREKFSQEIEKIDCQLEIVHKQVSQIKQKNLLSRLLHLGTIVSIKREESHLKSKCQRLHNAMKKELASQGKIHNDKVQKFNCKNLGYQAEIKKKVEIAQEKEDALEEILRSGSYFGAIAEMRMIDLLRKLPDNYYVVNDVKLRLSKGVRFDGSWLETSQIDHLVIGPSGVFVIEVKNWSDKFLSDGDFFDPYQQIKRHNYVCYTLLKRRFKTNVWNIIACAGHIPTKPNNSHVKVLPIEQVNNYILWFKDIKHDNETVQRIAHFIESEIRY